MSSRLGAVLGTVFVVIAVVQVVTMFEVLGGRKHAPQWDQRLRLAHRLSGYGFAVLYAVMLGGMLLRLAQYQGELDARTAIHMTLAAAMFPALVLKILIARRYAKFINLLPALGIANFTLALAMNSITAGYYWLRQVTTPHVSIASADRSQLDPLLGRELLDQKCVRCHTLERVFAAKKDAKGWEATVNRMMALDPVRIRTGDAGQILHFLIELRALPTTAEGEDQVAGQMFEGKCAKCHGLDRALALKDTAQGWQDTVEAMRRRDPKWLSEEEAVRIARFLDRRFGIDPSQPGAAATLGHDLFQRRCNKCHDYDEALKKPQMAMGEWRRLVAEMRDNDPQWIQAGEIEAIAAYLAGRS